MNEHFFEGEYGVKLKNYAHRVANGFHGLSVADRDDYVQAAMLGVWLKRDLWKEDGTASFSTWAVQAMRYGVLNEIQKFTGQPPHKSGRKGTRRQVYESMVYLDSLPDDPETPAESVYTPVTIDDVSDVLLDDLMADLPEPEAEIIGLLRDDHTISEAARVLGKHTSTVNEMAHTAGRDMGLEPPDLVDGYALCQCGCGAPAPIARQTESAKGYVKGGPMRFIHGHGRYGIRHRPGPEPVAA